MARRCCCLPDWFPRGVEVPEECPDELRGKRCKRPSSRAQPARARHSLLAAWRSARFPILRTLLNPLRTLLIPTTLKPSLILSSFCRACVCP